MGGHNGSFPSGQTLPGLGMPNRGRARTKPIGCSKGPVDGTFT
jgi:hypothetical protein